MHLRIVVLAIIFAETYSQLGNSSILKHYPILRHSNLLIELISRSYAQRTSVVSIYTVPKTEEESESVFAVAGTLLRELRDDFLINSYRDRVKYFDWDYNVIVSDSIVKLR